MTSEPDLSKENNRQTWSDCIFESFFAVINNKKIALSASIFFNRLFFHHKEESTLTSLAHAGGVTIFYSLNEYLKQQKIVQNNDLIYSLQVASYATSSFKTVLPTTILSYATFSILRSNSSYYRFVTPAIVSIASGKMAYEVMNVLNLKYTTNSYLNFAIPVTTGVYAAYKQDLVYETFNYFYPINETATTYRILGKFLNTTNLSYQIEELTWLSGNSQLAIGGYGILILKQEQKLWNQLLQLNNGVTSYEFALQTLQYIFLMGFPYVLTRSVLETVAQNELNDFKKYVSLQFTSYVTKNDGLVLLKNSQSTFKRYYTVLDTSIETVYTFFEKQAFQLPKIIVFFNIFPKHPLHISGVLSICFVVDEFKSRLVEFFANKIKYLSKQIDLSKARIEKITQHDASNAHLILQNKVTDLVSMKWEEEMSQLYKHIKLQETLNTLSEYINYFSRESIIYKLLNFIPMQLIVKKLAKVEEAFLYVRASEDCINTALTRSKSQTKLTVLEKDLDKLNDFVNKMISYNSNYIQLTTLDVYSNAAVSLYNVSFTRGEQKTSVQINDLKFIKGHVYAVTGSNGSGKSSLFSILSSKHENILKEIGFDEYEGTIKLYSKYVVIITQELYCRFFITPMEWISGQKMSSFSIEEKVVLEEKISKLLQDLRFFSGEKSNNINDTLYKNQDDWYSTLSTGQKTKIELIRQIFIKEKCPDIVLLDETFASLDPDVTKITQDKLQDFCADSTILVIYHATEDTLAKGFFTDHLHFTNGTAQFFDLFDIVS